jgi:2-C-methyl-D-erythritol 4-phosphate cytidylyltransferase
MEILGIKVNCMNPERTKNTNENKNFGNEPDSSLLKPEVVALRSLQTLLSSYTGQVIDVRL